MGEQVCTICPGHMTKMVAKPIYGKNPLKIFKVDDLGTWYVELQMWGLPSLLK